MSKLCKTSLQYIDGKPAPNFYGMEECDVEQCLWVDYGYNMVPNDDVTSITKNDLVNHPEKFRPFEYSKLLNFTETYDEIATKLNYRDKKWRYGYEEGIKIAPSLCNKNVTCLDEVLYMKKNYPWLYKKLLKKNGLSYSIPDPLEQNENQNKETVSGSGGNTKSIITPNEVNEDEKGVEINYTYIPESPDLKL